MSNPLISVVIPTYNHADYLTKTLNSVLAQTYQPLEIIVANDGSTDQTEHIGRLYRQLSPSIQWITHANRGPAFTRNRAIQMASGKYIALLDSDDLMHPERLAIQYHLLFENPSIDIVHTALQLIDFHDQPIGEVRGRNYPPENFLAFMLFRNLIPNPSTILAKSECLKKFPYNENFKHAEDYELMTRLAEHYQFFYIDSLLTSYRRHASNLSNDLHAHRQAEKKVLERYSSNQIHAIVQKTTLSKHEKKLLEAKIYYNQEKFDEALENFQQLSTPLATFYAGNCYLKKQDFKRAAQSYKDSLAKDATNAACWNNLGVIYKDSNQSSQANECFMKALALQPNYLDAYYNCTQEENLKITWRELREHLIPYQLNS